jgi:hypothetical protein
MINCTKCGEIKDESSFRVRTNLKRGYQSWCKECENISNRKKYIPKPPKPKKEIDGDKVKLESKIRLLKYRYNLSYDDYLKFYEEQGGKCKICGESKELGTCKGLVIDHCHTTNKVRGLLCGNCNSGLGKFMDNVELLNNAVLYIKQYNSIT